LGLALACDGLLDRLNPSREQPRGGSTAQDPAPAEGTPAAPPAAPGQGAGGAAPGDVAPDPRSGSRVAPVPPPNTPTDMPPPTLPIVPPGPNARTEDEDNSIRVFRAVAPSTVFVTKANIVFDRFARP